MKILYVTDLHGDKNKYRKSLEIAMKQEIRVIVNGGDMLPKLGERHTEQPLFIKGFLSNYFSILQEHNITYLNMLGNDDLLSVDNLFEQTCGGFANVHNIAGKKICIDEYEFIGMNQILDVRIELLQRQIIFPKDNLAFLQVYRMNMVMTEFLTGWSILKQNFH